MFRLSCTYPNICLQCFIPCHIFFSKVKKKNPDTHEGQTPVN